MHKKIIRLIPSFVFAFTAVFTSYAAENYADWDHSQKILLNTTSVASGGAGVTSNVYRFPVLIRLTPGNFRFFNQTNDGGSDIRFATNNGKHLAYQIERWTDNANDNDTADIWVAVDTIYGNTISHRLVMYWGNTDAVDSSNSYAVFDSSNGFTGTYHLTDTKHPADSVEDASSFRHTGINRASVDTTAGLIGSARYFDGTTFFGLGQFPNRPIGTLSCWVKLNTPFDATTTRTLGIWCLKKDDGYNASLCLRGTDFNAGSTNATGAFQTKCEFNNTGVYVAGKTRSFDANRWYYVTWSWGSGNSTVSLNGTVESDTALSYTVGSDNGGWDVVGTGVFDVANITDTLRRFIGMIDEFRMDNVKRSTAWISLSYQNQKPSQALVTTNGTFKWDIGTAAGIQAGSGTWGTSSFWTLNETQLTAWPGRGYCAQFGGTAGTYTVTVKDTQSVDSIAFIASTYTLSGGQIDFGTSRGAIFCSPGVTATINSVISGSGGLSVSKTASTLSTRLNLNGTNTYTGVTSVTNDIWCNAATLADGGTACAIGSASADAANIVLDGGVLRYTGTTDVSTDRLFTLTNNNGYIYASGSGSMNFTGTGPIGVSGSGNRILEFGGLYAAGVCRFAPVIRDGTGGKTSVVKTGDNGTNWIFSAANTYAGTTTVLKGALIVNGSLASGSAVTVASIAGLGGSGTINGTVNDSGMITPGYNGPGKLTTGALTLRPASLLNFDLGTESDTLIVNGNITLDGTLNIAAGAGFSAGTYLICKWSGTLTNNTVNAGTTPSGFTRTITLTDSTLSVTFTDAVLLQKNPSDTTVTVGNKAAFSVTATGSVTYKWQKEPSDSVIGTTATYTTPAAKASDNNTKYRCIVSNGSITDTSTWAVLTVIDKPHITGQSHDTTILVGEAVTFTVTVGDTAGCRFAWCKAGDTTTLSSANSYDLLSAAQTNTGSYLCSVTNPAGTVQSDTIHLTVTYPKPKAKFTFSPAKGTLPLEVSFTDSSAGFITSRLWDFGDTESDSSINPKHTYTKSGIYTVKLVVSGPGGKDSSTVTSGITVTGTKSNPLTLEGSIIKQRNVRITINNVGQVDTSVPEPWCDSIGLWISAGELPRNSTSATLLKRYPRSKMKSSSIIDTITFPSTDSVYGVIAGIYWGDGTISDFMVMNGMTVDFRDKSSRQNPLRITASSHEGTDVRIVLSNVDKIDTLSPAPVCDSIGIWIMPDSLPKNYNAASLMASYPRKQFTGSSIVDTLHLPKSDSVYGIMTGLFWNDGTIGDFLPENGTLVDLRDTTSVVVSDTALPSRLHLKSLVFDSLKAALRVSWCIDSLKSNEDLEVAVSYSTESYPVGKTDNHAFVVLSSCTDTLVQTRNELLFDTLYFVRLFIRSSGGQWVGGGNDTRDTIRTGSYFRQVVSYFDTAKSNDTVRVFNNQVILWKDSTTKNPVTLTDTLQVYTVKTPAGFASAGTPVKFTIAVPGETFYIGFKVALPDSSRSVADVRVYRDSAGALLVDYNTVIDSVHGIVYVKTADPRRAFIPLIDTAPPRVKFLTNVDSIANAEFDLVDSVTIRDNVSNLNWQYLYSSADKAPAVRDSGRLNDTISTKKLFISKSDHVISSDYGIRAFLIVYDGVFRDTFNLSRSVYRKNSDPSTNEAKFWKPLFPTAVLEGSDPDSLIIAQVSPEVGYDTRQIRLCRWVSTDANKNLSEKWVEYDTADNAVKKLFTIVPGKLLWLKTRKNVTMSLGHAKTLSLKDTFSIKLPPRQFTDFGMPFRFAVSVRDILAASGTKSESLQFFAWTEDSKTSRYKCENLYVPDLPGHSDKSVVMKGENGSGYSLYNPLDDTVTLRIPSTLAVSDSSAGGQAKKTATKNWNIRIIAQTSDGYTFPPLCCGYVAGVAKSNFPVPPSFEKVSLQFFNRSTGSRQADYIHDDAANGIVQEFQIVNSSDSATEITYRFESSGAFPEGYSVQLYDITTQQFTDGGTIAVPSHTTKSYWVTVGDNGLREHFLADVGSFAYALHHVYPNPARSYVTISYSVPMGAQERLKIAIFDLNGRRIWEESINRLLTAGLHTTTWNGCNRSGIQVGAGMYLLKVSIVNQASKTVRHFDRTITWLP